MTPLATPVAVKPETKAHVATAKQATETVAMLTSTVVSEVTDGIKKAVDKITPVLVETVDEAGGVSGSGGAGGGTPSHPHLNQLKVVGKAGVQAFVKVLDGIDDAFGTVGTELKTQSASTVQHRYGDEAAEVVEELGEAAGTTYGLAG